MDVQLETIAEKHALSAESLKTFGGINLLHLKRQISVLLELIGRGGIFDEYTRHDVSHIDEMLRIFEWLIPGSTVDAMSPADWLLLVLSTYFHDLGMLVTRHEYERRQESGFLAFCDDVLFTKDDGIDYRSRISLLPDDKKERFLYQEFVRHHHASRVRNWILGRESDHLGVSHEALQAVDELLSPLSKQFRRDLGLVCESHHLDDLGNLSKYKLSQPYGNSDAETANLQYVAVLLRSADLLHITSDRTPSIAFRLISPTDPLSQVEWAKQMAVKRVRPKLGLDSEGTPSPMAPKDTIEVCAFFTSPDGFFGLSSFLRYAEKQLQQSHEWVDTAHRLHAAYHEFPWLRIDETNIETEGFIRDTFQFTIDQARILDLLTGHTLYNDSRVVLRELVQNSLDAIRLQRQLDGNDTSGNITIRWDSGARILSVEDDGTGMTQSIITKYLLTVGSSRYQDPDFKKEHPDFYPISRFGIGVLSCFMIAHTVEVLTCHPEEDAARQLTLRSVHGKYLIRVLDKAASGPVAGILPHGTVFRLCVRPSVDVPDVLQTAHEWVMLPGCNVKVAIDNEPPIPVGYQTVKQALTAQLAAQGEAVVDFDVVPREDANRRVVRVASYTMGSVDLAYAVAWDPWFREWCYLTIGELRGGGKLLLGTCIGGIRVDANTPGFDKRGIVALANLTGPQAPRTNVARYGLESTAERDEALAAIYALYFRHAAQEMSQLQERRSFSLTWAAHEAQYVLAPLLGRGAYFRSRDDRPEPIAAKLFGQALCDAPLIVTETSGSRAAGSISDLHSHSCFWTIDSSLCRSVEWLLREISTDSSLRSVTDALTSGGLALPSEPILCTLRPAQEMSSLLFGDREVGKIVARQSERRLDLCWVTRRTPSIWIEMPRDAYLAMRRGRYYSLTSEDDERWIVARGAVEVDTEQTVSAIRSLGRIFVLPDTPLARYMLDAFDRVTNSRQLEDILFCAAVVDVARYLFRSSSVTVAKPQEDIPQILRQVERNLSDSFYELRKNLMDLIDVRVLCEVAESTVWDMFDPSAWERRPIPFE